MSGVGTGDEACKICKKHEPPNYFCIDCGLTFCKTCWSEAPSHAPGVVNRDGMPHEMINKQIAARLGEIFTPSSDPERQRQLHEMDANTTWFGVTRNITGSPVLQDYGRYSTIMRESSTGVYAQRWPQLVSFVGQTGAGKSTLVKTLVDYQDRNKQVLNKEKFPSPVAGSVNDHAPTSGDVHLYADPATYYTQSPMLYADCEGMDGGEKIPMGAKYKHNDLTPAKGRARLGSMVPQSTYGLPRKPRKLNKAVKREIRWAITPEKCKREFAVRNLYSRLLYAFSDIVVFVLRNDRTFESAALVPMLQWAASSVEGSVNAAAMPHAIIVLNFTDPNIHPDGWTVESATTSLLNTYAKAVYENADVKTHAQYWQQRDRPITSTKDLLLCYYSSVSVVRIPQKGRYGLVDKQIAELNQQVHKRCKEARQNRRQLRIIFNAEEFQAALSMGFDHFSNRLDEPFNFVELSWNLNPIPKDFGGNILRLALAIKDDPKMAGATGPQIFQHLGHMVASCVMLDYVRHQIKGTASRLLLHYKENYSRALKEFCEDWWPCSFEYRGSRCINTQRGHIRGHQDARGRLISTGVYQSENDFSEKSFEAEWHGMLNDNLEHIREQMDRMITGEIAMEEELAAEVLHLKRMNEFYSNLGDLSSYMNHSACFCCLRELPEHPLPCGHVLCSPCVKSYARRKNRVTYGMESCPLHEANKWDQEWEIPIKPHLAGVRILTLDGGGIRGIVELQVLAEIQRHLGRLPIANFFDLIVGTSTGGLVALGLGVKNWSVELCANKFQSLCHQAFSPSEFHNVPILEQLSTLNHKGKYKTRPYRDALKDAFNEKDQLFGGICEEARSQRKVAVVSTSETGQRAAILTNYNRLQRDAEPDYTFERPEKGRAELKIWEACRATSAATGYFKPFENDRTGMKYIDGALYYNNPIRVANQERKLLWPDVESHPPDIILSIGTSCTPESTTEGSKWKSWVKPKWFQVAVNRFDNILDAQNAWDQFYEEVREPSSSVGQRYIRLNPELKTKVKLDDVESLRWLKDSVTEVLRSSKWKHDTKAIAQRLIATSFFFEKDPNAADESIIQGWIHCRFPDESAELRLLGQHFQNLQSMKFSPHFVITEQHQDQQGSITVIPKEVITSMIQESTFNIEKVNIRLSSKLAKTTISLCFSKCGETFPISGFPRHLVTEEVAEVAAKQVQIQADKRYGSLKRNGRDPVIPASRPPASSLSIPTTSSQKREESPTSGNSSEEIPAWAWSYRGHLRKRSFKTLRGRKNGAEMANTSGERLNGSETPSINLQSTFGGIFKRSNTSQVTLRAGGTESPQRHSSDEPLSREYSSKSLPEIRSPGMKSKRHIGNETPPTAEHQFNPPYSMRATGHERQISDSLASTSQQAARNTNEARRLLRKSRSQSLQLPLSASTARQYNPPPPVIPTSLNNWQSARGPENPVIYDATSYEGRENQPVSPQPKRIEDMSEEEMMEVALRESSATAPNMSEEEMMEMALRESAATSPTLGPPEYEAAQSTISRTTSDVSSSSDATYTIRSSQPRDLPDAIPSGNVETMLFQSTPRSNLPRTEDQIDSIVNMAEIQHSGPFESINPENMTDEEMVAWAIAESLRSS